MYRLLAFPTRSDAVRYCLQVSDALESARLVGDRPDGEATLWLTAADDLTGSVRVVACDCALGAARAAGIEADVEREVREGELPAARCLVIGDRGLVDA